MDISQYMSSSERSLGTFTGSSPRVISPFIPNSLNPDLRIKDSPIPHDQETWSKEPAKEVKSFDFVFQLAKIVHVVIPENSFEVWCPECLTRVLDPLVRQPIQDSGVMWNGPLACIRRDKRHRHKSAIKRLSTLQTIDSPLMLGHLVHRKPLSSWATAARCCRDSGIEHPIEPINPG